MEPPARPAARRPSQRGEFWSTIHVSSRLPNGDLAWIGTEYPRAYSTLLATGISLPPGTNLCPSFEVLYFLFVLRHTFGTWDDSCWPVTKAAFIPLEIMDTRNRDSHQGDGNSPRPSGAWSFHSPVPRD